MSDLVSPIHKGLIIEKHHKPGYVVVMIPTGNTIVPPGFSEYVYENSGGQLYGKNLENAKGTAYVCKVASPLTAGAWWRADPSRACSYFDDYYNESRDYRITPNYQTRGNNGTSSYTLSSDNPQASGIGSVSTLSVAGGTPKPSLGTMPKGDFPRLEINQTVIVAFVHSSINPVVLANLHSDEAWQVI